MDRMTAMTAIGAVVLVVLVIQSGVLWWAIPAGIVSASTAFYFLRDLKVASIAGASATAGISLLGVVNLLNPGWYSTVL